MAPFVRPLKPMSFLGPAFFPRSVGACAESPVAGGAVPCVLRGAGGWSATPLGGTVGSECRVGDVRGATAGRGPGGLGGCLGQPGAILTGAALGRAGRLQSTPAAAGLPRRPAPSRCGHLSRNDSPVHAMGAWAAGDTVRSRFTRGGASPPFQAASQVPGHGWGWAAERPVSLQPGGRQSRSGDRGGRELPPVRARPGSGCYQ